MHDMRHLDYIDTVREADVKLLREKEVTYQGSWKRAGGRSAWFMLRRNMDRLLTMLAPPVQCENFRVQNIRDLAENIDYAPFSGGKMNVQVHTSTHNYAEELRYMCRAHVAEDIFAKIEEHPGGEDGTVLACVRDLRCYLTLVEAEMMARGVVASSNTSKTIYMHETVNPGTPEDGGHHAGFDNEFQWPYVIPVDMAYGVFNLYDVSELHRELFWAKRGQRYVLDVQVESVELPYALRRYMLPDGGNAWLIDIKTVPDKVRSEFPSLARDHNAIEHGELPPWQRKLYVWHPDHGKYMLTIPEWHVEV